MAVSSHKGWVSCTATTDTPPWTTLKEVDNEEIVEPMSLVAISMCKGGSQQMERSPTAINGLILGEQAWERKSSSYARVIARKQEPVGRCLGGGRIHLWHGVEVVTEEGAVFHRKARSCATDGVLSEGARSHGSDYDANDIAWSWIFCDMHPLHEQAMLSHQCHAHYHCDGCRTCLLHLIAHQKERSYINAGWGWANCRR